MSLKNPSDKPDAARPESVEPVTLSDRVNAVINPTADPSPDAASQANGLTDELAHESADDAGETDDTGKAAGANAQSSETIGIFGARKDTFSARYHLTRRGKLRRLAQIAQIANKFDVVHGLTPVKMRLMLEALGPTFSRSDRSCPCAPKSCRNRSATNCPNCAPTRPHAIQHGAAGA